MDPNEQQPDCQIKDIHQITDAHQEAVPFRRAVRLIIRRILGPRNVRLIKTYAYNSLNWYVRLRGKTKKQPKPALTAVAIHLKTRDQVRVRSKDEIEATLDHWGKLKGCSFIPEMAQYCNTTQRILKPVERFIDERDLRARKTKGIVLLEGIVCQGTASLGRCDRNCYYFWREEWLEKIDIEEEVTSSA